MWIILDEIHLELVMDIFNRVIEFESKDEAVEYAGTHIDGWQVIEIS